MEEQREETLYIHTEPRSIRSLLLARRAFYRARTCEMVWLARTLGLRRQQAEVIAQIAWQKFFEQGPAFSEANAAECRAWLLAVAHNEAVNWHRDRNRHECQSLNALPVEPIDDREEGNGAAEREAILDELEKLMKELQDRDPVNHRLLVGHHIAGRDIKELAEAEGLTVRAVWNRLARTRAKLRERLTRFREKLDFT